MLLPLGFRVHGRLQGVRNILGVHETINTGVDYVAGILEVLKKGVYDKC